MARTCSQCRSTNPLEASYCYQDGVRLAAPAAGPVVPGGALDIGARPFTVPFVLASGRACHNFEQLALACHAETAATLEVLRKGHLEAFLAGQGRIDLAEAAHAAAHADDRERGLDDFLGRLPAEVLAPPKLRVDTAVLDLGTFRPGEDRRCDLVLHNDGKRLLYGSANCAGCAWLSLGDGAGVKNKLVQFSGQLVLSLQVHGRTLRAYPHHQEAEVRLETNGGAVALKVRLLVPVQPFPRGVLAGATTPRQLADKTRAAPAEAATLIESGAVARWYKENGWTYPVTGPTAAGMAAVQQLFEALGLAKAPRIELSEDTIALRGQPGEAVEHVLAVLTHEDRLVVAHGSSDQPWLQVGRTVFRGRSAFVPLAVRGVPPHPGETLKAQVTVYANGGQRFVVPVTLAVIGRAATAHPAPPPEAVRVSPVKLAAAAVPMTPILPTPPLPAARDTRPTSTATPGGRDTAPAPPPRPTAPVLPTPSLPAVAPRPAAITPVLPTPPLPTVAPVAQVAPAAPRPAPEVVTRPPPAPPSESRSLRGLMWTLLPAYLLVMALMGVVLRDYYEKEEPAKVAVPPPEKVDSVPRIDIRFHDAKKDDELEKLWLANSPATMRFGVVMLRNGKEVGQGVGLKRLTFDQWGRTNNTCLRFDNGDERLFGSSSGAWVEREARSWKEDGKDHEGFKSAWMCDDKRIQVTQFVELVRGDQSNLLDTCRVRYLIENQDTVERPVGLRVLLDTYIGGNDGVPFTIPGETQLCTDMKDLPSQAKDKTIPDFLQALEKPDLAKPGTIAHLRLKLDKLEPPVRVTLGAWPNDKLRILARNALGPMTLWDVPVLPLKSLDLNDSAITIYWAERPLKPGEKREVGFEYGQWNLASKSSELATTVDGSFRPNGTITVVAYVGGKGPDDETLTLTLPHGFEVLQGPEKQAVPKRDVKGGNRPVTWKVKAGATGKYELTVKSSAGPSQTVPVEIKRAIFD